MVGIRRASGRVVLIAAIAILAGPGSGFLLQGEMGLIRLYQQWASPTVGRVVTCRFDPSCSHFGLAVLQQFGLWKGNWMLAGRLLECSPLGVAREALGWK